MVHSCCCCCCCAPGCLQVAQPHTAPTSCLRIHATYIGSQHVLTAAACLQVAQALLDRALAPPLALTPPELLQLMTAAQELGACARPEQVPLLQQALQAAQQKPG